MWFVGGCRRAIAVHHIPFALVSASIDERCSTGRLHQASTHREALDCCRLCPEAEIESYLEERIERVTNTLQAEFSRKQLFDNGYRMTHQLAVAGIEESYGAFLWQKDGDSPWIEYMPHVLAPETPRYLFRTGAEQAQVHDQQKLPLPSAGGAPSVVEDGPWSIKGDGQEAAEDALPTMKKAVTPKAEAVKPEKKKKKKKIDNPFIAYNEAAAARSPIEPHPLFANFLGKIEKESRPPVLLDLVSWSDAHIGFAIGMTSPDTFKVLRLHTRDCGVYPRKDLHAIKCSYTQQQLVELGELEPLIRAEADLPPYATITFKAGKLAHEVNQRVLGCMQYIGGRLLFAVPPDPQALRRSEILAAGFSESERDAAEKELLARKLVKTVAMANETGWAANSLDVKRWERACQTTFEAAPTPAPTPAPAPVAPAPLYVRRIPSTLEYGRPIPQEGSPEYEALPMYKQAEADQARFYEQQPHPDEFGGQDPEPRPLPQTIPQAAMAPPTLPSSLGSVQEAPAALPNVNPNAPMPQAAPAPMQEQITPESIERYIEVVRAQLVSMNAPPQMVEQQLAVQRHTLEQMMAAQPTVMAGMPAPKPDFKTLLELPGPSLLGPSAIRTARKCLRAFFYERVLGIQMRREPEYHREDGTVKFNVLILGTLVHYLLQRHYEGKSVDLSNVAQHYPAIANEAMRLYAQYIDKYYHTDQQMLDIRAVEHETRYVLPKRRVKSAGKQKQLMVSMRSDLVFAKRQPGAGVLPPGELPKDGLTIHDFKTAGRITRDIGDTLKWAHEIQVLQSIALWNEGRAVLPNGQLATQTNAETLGTVREFSLTFIGKAQDHDPEKHLVRTDPVIPRSDVIESYRDELANFVYEEIAERLYHKEGMQEGTWSKSYLCTDPVTHFTCPFLTICTKGGLANYNPETKYSQVEFKVVSPETIEAPTAKRGRKKKADAAADVENK